MRLLLKFAMLKNTINRALIIFGGVLVTSAFIGVITTVSLVFFNIISRH